MGRNRRDLRHATVAELVVQLEDLDLGHPGVFDRDVVLELARRAEQGERLQARVRAQALRELAPADGYSVGNF